MDLNYVWYTTADCFSTFFCLNSGRSGSDFGSGAEAAEVGLVTEVVPHEKLMTRAQVGFDIHTGDIDIPIQIHSK